jgi:hypothetical protein
VHFFILSGKFGLVEQSQPIPWYDHLLVPDEISTLAALVTQQLRGQGLTVLRYFTGSPASDAQLMPYLQVIVSACSAAGVDLQVCVLVRHEDCDGAQYEIGREDEC